MTVRSPRTGEASADVSAVADGAAEYLFVHMEVMMGRGRDEATREEVARNLYEAAEAHLRPRLSDRPFALSLEVRELSAASERRWNTIRDAIGGD